MAKIEWIKETMKGYEYERATNSPINLYRSKDLPWEVFTSRESMFFSLFQKEAEGGQ